MHEWANAIRFDSPAYLDTITRVLSPKTSKVPINRVTAKVRTRINLSDFATYQELMVRVTISLPTQEEAMA